MIATEPSIATTTVATLCYALHRKPKTFISPLPSATCLYSNNVMRSSVKHGVVEPTIASSSKDLFVYSPISSRQSLAKKSIAHLCKEPRSEPKILWPFPLPSKAETCLAQHSPTKQIPDMKTEAKIQVCSFSIIPSNAFHSIAAHRQASQCRLLHCLARQSQPKILCQFSLSKVARSFALLSLSMQNLDERTKANQ